MTLTDAARVPPRAMGDLHGEIDGGDIHTDGGDRYRPGPHREFAAALCDVRERAAGGLQDQVANHRKRLGSKEVSLRDRLVSDFAVHARLVGVTSSVVRWASARSMNTPRTISSSVRRAQS